MVSDFHFLGQLPASKSLLNRVLILKSYFNDLEIIGDSQCDDVILMKKGIDSLEKNSPIDCGESGAVLRFLALRVSRISGEHILKGSRRLFQRPQQDLVKILRQLGMDVELGDDFLKIRSDSWKCIGDSLHIQCDKSSQFASAILLNSWGLEKPFHFSLSRQMASSSYWNMTLQLILKLGLKVETWGQDYRVPTGQNPIVLRYRVEPDADCMFAVGALAALSGKAHIRIHPEKSLQPNHVFVNILRKMNVPVGNDSKGNLIVGRARPLRAIRWNMMECSDLFPVLAALCSRANGESCLYGAKHLRYKESHRILNMAKLLGGSGCQVEVLEDGLIISGKKDISEINEFDFDTDSDHRLAMAAGTLKKSGVPVNILGKEVVSKSFPRYWSLAGL